MVRRLAYAAAGLLLLAAPPAFAEDRELCPERPGQTTPPCTLDPGRVMIETGLVEWTRESDPISRTDVVTIGETMLRIGVTSRLEAQVGWTPLGVQWQHGDASGAVTRRSSGGDATLGLKLGLAGESGPIALQGFVTLPMGGAAIGADDWGAGMRLPVQLGLGGGLQVGVTPEVDAAVNGSGSGRHLAYGGAAGVGVPLGEKLNLGLDVAVFRDDDPDGPETTASGGVALAWQAGKNTQFDLGGTIGLNQASPDGALYFGIAHKF